MTPKQTWRVPDLLLLLAPSEFLNLLKPPNRPSAREAFFDAFSQRARWVISTLPASTLSSPPPLILLTGGLRTRSGIASVLSSPSKTPPTADLVGLGRPAAADPSLPLRLVNPSVPSRMACAPEYDSLAGVRMIRWLFGWLSIAGPGLDVMYHTMLMRQIALRRVAAKRRGGRGGRGGGGGAGGRGGGRDAAGGRRFGRRRAASKRRGRRRRARAEQFLDPGVAGVRRAADSGAGVASRARRRARVCAGRSTVEGGRLRSARARLDRNDIHIPATCAREFWRGLAGERLDRRSCLKS